MCDKIHVFEAAGLGKAPFRLVGLFSIPPKSLLEANPDAYNNQMRQAPRDVGVGTCHFCSTAIMANFIIQSHDKKKSAVGCDCVQKTGDKGLVDAVKLAQKKADREKREAINEVNRIQRLQAQREKNGGLTDWEKQEKELKAAQKIREKKLAKVAAILAPLADLLADGRNGFRDSVANDMRQGCVPKGGGRSIMLDILGKLQGRANSKAYDAEFDRVSKILDKAEKQAAK
jgi:hypothetical protein